MLAACSLGLALAVPRQGRRPWRRARRRRPALRSASTATSGRSSPTTALPATVRTRRSARRSSTSIPDEGAFAKDGIIVPGNAAESLLIERVTQSRSRRADAAARVRARADRPRRSSCCAAGSTRARSGTRTGRTRRRRGRNRPPVEQRGAGSRNPIDRFILARLEREGLKPSPRGRQDDAAAPRRPTT